MNRHPQGQLSRADLLEALVAADNQAVEYLTRQLGLSLYVEPIFTKPLPEPEIQTPKPNKDDLPKSTNETHNQSASGIWKLDKREDTPQQAWPEIITQQEAINSPPLIAEPPKHYPLTSPRSLLARLFHRLKYQQDSCDIDVEAIVKKLSRGEHLTVLPKTHRRSLGKHLHLIDDRQLHLTPYWRDHTFFARLFEALLPNYASSRAVLQSGRPLPYSYTDSGFLTEWQLPPEGSVVLVFSDLGALALQADNKIATWLHIARTLAKRHCKLIALVPCHPNECDVRLKSLFNIESWETPQHLTPCLLTQRQSQAEYLLTLLAPAIRLEPSLLRQFRITLAKHDIHIHAAVESIVWQHPDMQEHSSVAATINSDARCQKWLPRFQAETRVLQQTALDILRTWRTRLPPEIWYEEIVSLDKMASKLITEQDLVAAKNYFWQLIQPGWINNDGF